MMIVGLGLGIPHHVWYLFLDRLLPGTALLTVAKKILLDQATFSPFASFFFFMSSGLLEGQSVRQSWQELKTKFPMVYKVQTDMSTDIILKQLSFDFLCQISLHPKDSLESNMPQFVLKCHISFLCYIIG